MARRPRRQTVPSKSERALTPRVARAAVIPSEPNLASTGGLGCRPERADALTLRLYGEGQRTDGVRPKFVGRHVLCESRREKTPTLLSRGMIAFV